MDQVWIALIVGVVSMASPLLLAMVTNINANKNKRIDWAREDAVAARAAKVAITLQDSNDKTNTKLDVIHTLVNSNMTAAMQAEHDATVRELAMMREVAALHQNAGQRPSVDTLAAIKSTEDKIAELQAALKDRLKQ